MKSNAPQKFWEIFGRLNRVAAGVSPLQFLKNEMSRLTSAATMKNQMVGGKRLDKPVLQAQAQIREMQWLQICGLITS
jgi:hypothetical protein